MSFTNAMYWFIRQFEITGKYNTTSIYKAFTLIFTLIARSKYEVQLHGLYYKVDLNSKNGTRNNCTILDVKAPITIKGLRDLDEMLLIESWITTMSVKVTDTDESGNVMRFYPATNSSLCKLLTKEELSRMVEHRYLLVSDPTMWRDIPPVFRFIQTASFTSDPLCFEVEFQSTPQKVNMKCLNPLRSSAKSSIYLSDTKGFENIILTCTYYWLPVLVSWTLCHVRHALGLWDQSQEDKFSFSHSFLLLISFRNHILDTIIRY